MSSISITRLLVAFCAATSVLGAPSRYAYWPAQITLRKAGNDRHLLSAGIVVAGSPDNDMSWVKTHLPSYKHYIHKAHTPTSALAVQNKASEALVYLTHIIDNYDNLQDITVFIHARLTHRQLHDPTKTASRLLRQLNLTYIEETGYANLRCDQAARHTGTIRPLILHEQYMKLLDADPDTPATYGMIYRNAYAYLLGGEIPDYVKATGGAHFAVSRSAIHERTRADYVRYREYLLLSEYDVDVTTEVLEYMWHIIFGQEPSLQPDAQSCYCSLYGICRPQWPTYES